jgi:O-antigen/teichoic acid export membrane protein
MLLLLVGLLSFIVLHFYGAKLITVLFGPRYAEAGNYLQMLSPILLVRSLALSLTLTLISKNLHARRLIPQSIALVFKVLAGGLLLSGFGFIDYPAILIISECVLVVGLSVIVRKYVLNKRAIS